MCEINEVTGYMLRPIQHGIPLDEYTAEPVYFLEEAKASSKISTGAAVFQSKIVDPR